MTCPNGSRSTDLMRIPLASYSLRISMVQDQDSALLDKVHSIGHLNQMLSIRKYRWCAEKQTEYKFRYPSEHWSTENIWSDNSKDNTSTGYSHRSQLLRVSSFRLCIYMVKKYTVVIPCSNGRLLDCPPITTTRGKSKVAWTLNLRVNKSNTKLRHSRRIYTQGHAMLCRGRLFPCTVWHSLKNWYSLQLRPRW